MNGKTLKVLIEAGAFRCAAIIADGATVHVKFTTRNGDSNPATTMKGDIKTWTTLDAAAKWLRALGIGEAKLNIAKWTPGQRGML